MSRTQASNLSVAILSFLAVIVLLFFAATESKNAAAFIAIAVFFSLAGIFWVYRFAKGRRAS